MNDWQLLAKQRDVLVERLNRGWDMIDEAIKNRLNPKDLEDFWCMLLQQYQDVCDEIGEGCDVEDQLRGRKRVTGGTHG